MPSCTKEKEDDSLSLSDYVGIYQVEYCYWLGNSDIDINGFGLPLAFAYRTRTRSTQQRLSSALAGAMDGADIFYGTSDDRAGGALGGLLMSIFSDLEFYAGITPRYTTWPSGSVSHATWGGIPGSIGRINGPVKSGMLR